MKTWIQIETDEGKPNWYKSRKRATELVGHDLGKAEIHHHTDGTIVICEDRAYHFLLHQRTDALRACEHPSWRRCRYCGVYSDPSKMKIEKDNTALHTKCQSQWSKLHRLGLDAFMSVDKYEDTNSET